MMRYRWGLGFASIMLAVILVGCIDDQKEQIAGQNEAAGERVGIIPIFDLRVGDCFIDSPGFLRPEIIQELTLELTLVACSDVSADIRVIRAFNVGRVGLWPGDKYLGDEAVKGCPGFEDEFDEFAVFFTPSLDSWEAGDRTITCLRSLR